jgi:hypothetical protein
MRLRGLPQQTIRIGTKAPDRRRIGQIATALTPNGGQYKETERRRRRRRRIPVNGIPQEMDCG